MTLTAARRFEARRGVSFVAYARHRVLGAMLDDLRRADPAGRGSRLGVTEARACQISGAVVDELRRAARRGRGAAARAGGCDAVAARGGS